MYKLRLDEDAVKAYQKADADLVKRLNRCFEQLQESPWQHPNIKSLSGPLSGLHRYRIGNWRVIFEIDQAEQTVTILQIVHRSKAYR
jgi:mRNA interferase RelE/StbE